MNEFDGLPFRVIVDFAHNPDGMKNVCEFVDRTKVPGRKIIAFAGAGNRTEVAIANVARAVAGHFDFYFCKDYEPLPGSRRIRLAPFIRRILIEEGVPAKNTAVVTYGREVIYQILDSCQPGDLLMLLLGHVEKENVPALIREYASQKRKAGR
jgi:cyanophycin synthetase